MCGIFGYVTSKPGVGGRAALEAAISALRHRGPDDEATLELGDDALRCGLAFTRLAIIDLSVLGRQPMTTEDGRFSLVFNGEIYNHVELRRELEAEGIRFRGRSDTEVLLQAFARWGKACIPRLRGMFAFGVWDAEERALVLVRDHLGIKPLYFAIAPSRIAFSSEVRALVAVGFASKTISRRAIASFLGMGSVAEPDTILEGVAPLAPGSILEYREGRARTKTYFDLPLETKRPADPRAAVEELRAVLADAIRLRLVADVPLGVFLSGGIDSSVIAEVAARASSRPLHTFTITSDEDAYSEAHDAREVARRIGAEHQLVHLSGREIASWLPDAIDALDQPSVDGFNTYIVSRAARSAGLKVALSGLGGDEVFAGYANFSRFGPLLAAGRAGRGVLSFADRRLHVSSLLERAPQRARKLVDVLRASGSLEKTYLGMRSLFGPAQIEALCAPDVAEEGVALPVRIPERLEPLLACGAIDPENAYSALELSNYLDNTLLRDADVMSMRHALEVRVPLVDHVLIERVLPLPGDMKIARGKSKPLLVAAAGDFSKHVGHKPKRGFCLPFGKWLKGPLRPWAEELLLGEPARRAQFLDANTIAKYWRTFLEDEDRVGFTRIFGLLVLVDYLNRNETPS